MEPAGLTPTSNRATSSCPLRGMRRWSIWVSCARADETVSIAERPVLGTINYIAPEMLFSALGGDHRSDIYSLGVTLFEMLTGRLPFDAQDVAELAVATPPGPARRFTQPAPPSADACRAAGASNARQGAAAAANRQRSGRSAGRARGRNIRRATAGRGRLTNGSKTDSAHQPDVPARGATGSHVVPLCRCGETPTRRASEGSGTRESLACAAG